eukprot:559073-Prymnesium_polylepis.1
MGIREFERSLEADLPRESIDRLFAFFDSNGDGRIDDRERKKMVSLSRKTVAEEARVKAQQRKDASKGGPLSSALPIVGGLGASFLLVKAAGEREDEAAVVALARMVPAKRAVAKKVVAKTAVAKTVKKAAVPVPRAAKVAPSRKAAAAKETAAQRQKAKQAAAAAA